jgi:hypothetical protein
MKVAGTSETLVPVYQTSWRHIPDDTNSHSRRHENLKFLTFKNLAPKQSSIKPINSPRRKMKQLSTARTRTWEMKASGRWAFVGQDHGSAGRAFRQNASDWVADFNLGGTQQRRGALGEVTATIYALPAWLRSLSISPVATCFVTSAMITPQRKPNFENSDKCRY